jgi:hypothetical protein
MKCFRTLLRIELQTSQFHLNVRHDMELATFAAIKKPRRGHSTGGSIHIKVALTS